jgi:SAM-dependent methyltransferase
MQLLAQTRRRCPTRPVAADACRLPFPDHAFDIVISSECIEHTLDPAQALREILRVARPGAPVVVTVPNQLWRFSATIAAIFRLRPYEGYEHWMCWREVRRVIAAAGARVEVMRGFHLIPPLIRGLQPALRRIDRFGAGPIGPLMLNIAVRARR